MGGAWLSFLSFSTMRTFQPPALDCGHLTTTVNWEQFRPTHLTPGRMQVKQPGQAVPQGVPRRAMCPEHHTPQRKLTAQRTVPPAWACRRHIQQSVIASSWHTPLAAAILAFLRPPSQHLLELRTRPSTPLPFCPSVPWSLHPSASLRQSTGNPAFHHVVSLAQIKPTNQGYCSVPGVGKGILRCPWYMG